MILDLGNTQYNTEANLSEEEFKKTFTGRLNIDINEAWKMVSKHKPKKDWSNKTNKGSEFKAKKKKKKPMLD